MKISTKGLSFIKQFEGCRLTAYRDSAGILTIGYGHTRGVHDGQIISQEQADAYLRQDCACAEKNVNSFDNIYHWNQNQFDALVSFAFNIGSICQLTANGTRTIEEISAKIPAYCNAGGKRLTGLLRRRAAEKSLFDTPMDNADLNMEIKHGYDTEAIKSLQKALNKDGITDFSGKPLKVDGIKGGRTDSAIEKVLLKKGRYAIGSTGESVKWLQMRLNEVLGKNLKQDGKFGADTHMAVGLFQKIRGLNLDYIAGAKTMTELLIQASELKGKSRR